MSSRFDVMSAQHALVGPASLLLCQCLSQCPVRTAADVACGLLSCSVLAGFTRETKRLVPEAFEFVRSVMVLFSPTTTISPAAAAAASSSSSSSSAAGNDKHKAVAAVALAGPPQKTFDVPIAGSSSSSSSGSQGQALQALRSAAARLGRSKQSSSSTSSSSSRSNSKDEDSGGSSDGGLQIVWTAFGKDRSGDQSYPGRSVLPLPPSHTVFAICLLL